MKKLTITIIAICLLLCGCNVKPKADTTVMENIKNKYPDADITYNGKTYSTVVENVLPDASLDVLSSGETEKPSYDNLESLLNNINMINNIVIVGKKTTELKQYLEFDESGRLGWFHTESKLLITDVLYGDAKIGDKIVLKEWYAIVTDDTGKKTTFTLDGENPVEVDKEYLFVLGKASESGLFKGEYQYGITANARPALVSATTFESDLCAELHDKYIVKKDIAVDVDKEAKKSLAWKQELKNRGVLEKTDLTEQELSIINGYSEEGVAAKK